MGRIIFVVILIAAAVFIFFQRNDDTNKSLIIGENAIYVAEQAPSDGVFVSMVRLKKPGFVVIHEESGGSPSRILGVSNLLKAGETKTSTKVKLSRKIGDGETLYAMLHFDDGDGVFNASKDKPILFNSEPVMMIVTVDSDFAEPEAISL